MDAHADRVSGTIEMDLGGPAPAGALTGANGVRLAFCGWAELGSAIEQWRSAARDAPSSAGPGREPGKRGGRRR